MAKTTLYRLPTELLASVCEYLDDSHWPSLHSFSLSSKWFHSIAAPVVWKTLRLRITTRNKLEQDVQKLMDMYQCSYIVHSVRWLEVSGRMVPQEWREDDFRIKDGLLADSLPPEMALRSDGDWTSLATLMESMSALSDLVYRCSNQFPRCLLRVLHKHHIGARLHLENFHLRSLTPRGLDGSELEIASSPCLYAIEVQHDDADVKPVCMYNRKGVLDIVSHLAPNLREVTLERAFTLFDNRIYLSPHDPSVEPWLGLPPCIKRLDRSQGRLTKLALSDHSRRSASEMKAWAVHTDLSLLKVLRIDNRLEEDLLEWLSTECRFPSLKTFYLHAYASEDDAGSRNYTEPSDRYWLLLASFFETLPPLSTLRLSAGANCRSALFAALKNHSQSLRTLHLDPYDNAQHNPRRRGEIGPDQMKYIRQHCPLLEELRIKIRRSKGNLAELSIYETIGTFKRLQKVELALDAAVYLYIAEPSNGEHMDSSASNQQGMTETNFWEFDCNIRDALINAAMDDDLARSIFHVISRAKSSGSIPLEYLKVGIFNADRGPPRYPHPDLHNVIMHLGVSKNVSRNPRDDSRDELMVTSGSVPTGCSRKRPPPVNYRVLRCYRQLWPDKSGDWRKDWSSFPLAKRQCSAANGLT